MLYILLASLVCVCVCVCVCIYVYVGGGYVRACMCVCVWGMRKQKNIRVCQDIRPFSHRCVRPKKSIFVMLSDPFLLPDGPLLLTNAITNARDICMFLEAVCFDSSTV